MQDLLDQAFEAGRMAERKMAEIIKGSTLVVNYEPGILAATGLAPSMLGARKRAAKASTKAVEAPKATKTPVIARGVKSAPRPRTKGVKSAISTLITSGPMTVDGIIERTGFKKNSVISTLMDLKKKNLAMQDGKAWVSMGFDDGNSEAADHAYDSRMEAGS
jgi:predicted Rossmann fold nucleotide-binding protein DprA/Smf involved in DNA uptake